MSGNAGGKLMSEIDAEYQAVMDAKPMVARCGLCDWTFEGTAGEARSAQFEHRATHARDKTTKTNGKVKHLSQGLTADDRREAAQKMTTTTEKRWTREAILDAFARWMRLHGKPPTSTQWNQNKVDDDFPPAWAVAAEFGKWSEGVKAAGLASAPTGGPQRPARAAVEKPAPEPTPEPAAVTPSEPPVVSPAATRGSLTQLAIVVDEAQDALDQAIAAYDAAIAAHTDALQALRDAIEAA